MKKQPWPLSILFGLMLFLVLSVLHPADALAWKLAAAPLLTRWAKDVSPAQARPEYPRPQFVRKEWKNLNGLWDFAFDDANEGRSAGWASGKAWFKQQILVPWTFEAALSGIGKGKEVHERIWYHRTFDLPKAWKGQRVLLHFGAVDWESTVWVNGHEMGTHRGGYTPFSYDITQALKSDRPQDLVVAVYDPADPNKGAFQPKGKQLGSHGIWYTRTTGIWQTVWLEPVAQDHIAAARIEAVPSEDGNAGKISVRLDVKGRRGRRLDREIRLLLDSREVASASQSVREPGPWTKVLKVKAPRLWTPESPTLYDVVLRLCDGDRVVDEVHSYTAFRSVGVKDRRITLNGKPYFLRGVLDQGFWPDGIYTPPTDSAIKNDVVMTKAFGFNLARKHVKIEDPRWYYYCDKLGLLVAQDMPSSHNLQSPEAKKNFANEWREVLAGLRNHPAIILWIAFNEDWGHPEEFQDQMVDVARAMDGSRPIIDASGWKQRGKTDLTDIHDYGNNLKKHAQPHPGHATWIGEFGGVALPVPGHVWVKGWGYQTVKTPDQLVDKYRFLTDQINEAPGLSGFVYTQLTDVEQELNGLMTYDRIPKAKPARFAAVNHKKMPSAK